MLRCLLPQVTQVQSLIVGAKKIKTFPPTFYILSWVNNQISRDSLTGESQSFNPCAWGIHLGMDITKTGSVEYRGILYKGEKGVGEEMRY